MSLFQWFAGSSILLDIVRTIKNQSHSLSRVAREGRKVRCFRIILYTRISLEFIGYGPRVIVRTAIVACQLLCHCSLNFMKRDREANGNETQCTLKNRTFTITTVSVTKKRNC